MIYIIPILCIMQCRANLCDIFFKLLKNKIFRYSQFFSIIDIWLFYKLWLSLIPKYVFLELGVDFIFIDNCHADFEMSVQ